jgi:hypothetical protein
VVSIVATLLSGSGVMSGLGSTPARDTPEYAELGGEANAAAAPAATLPELHGCWVFKLWSTRDIHLLFARLPPYVISSADVFAIDPSVKCVIE